MIRADLSESRGLMGFIDAAPSPFHACHEAARMLEAAGFTRLAEPAAFEPAGGRFYVVRGGSLVAWAVDAGQAPATGFRVIGAHTDSPNLRVKPRPDTGRAGCRQVGVEVYGGVLLNSWLDRDLGLSGRVFLRGAAEPAQRLFKVDRPVMRVPQLAIHLDQDIKTKGLQLNKQTHMVPVLGLRAPGNGDEQGFRELLAAELDVDPGDVLSWDAMCHDVQPSSLLGADEEFVSAPRLDNLCSCFTALRALLARLEDGAAPDAMGGGRIPVVCLFDHEEVGSTSSRGANGPLLADLLERAVISRGGSREDYHRALADSVCLSADMAHATHPNYVELHDRDHTLAMNGGPVIKLNANQRYASEGETEALFQMACERADVPYQKWVNRTDLACGSTIGPATAARLGIRTVDVGLAQLAMHSVREMCGSSDPAFMIRAMTAFLA